MSHDGVNLFAGPGGTCEGARQAGLSLLGIEWDEAACATREAAGHPTLRADVASLDPQAFGPCEWLAGSPPCPTFSAAGKGGGRHLTDVLVRAMGELAAGSDTRAERREEAYGILEPVYWTAEQADAKKKRREPDRDKSRARARRDADMSLLVVEPLRWALALKPSRIMCEQVPDVLGLWTVMAQVLQAQGYRTWAGVLSSERYGVPQTRKRAILLASLDGAVHPPQPTHQAYVPGEPACEQHTLEGTLEPWVSMAEALGWGMTERPTHTVSAGGTGSGGGVEVFASADVRNVVKRERERGAWLQTNANTRSGEAPHRHRPNGVEYEAGERPAPTLDGSTSSWTVRTNNFTAKQRDLDGRRTSNGSVPYERPVDEPAPTVDTSAHGWAVTHYDRRQGTTRPNGEREMVRPIPATDPAPTLGADGLAKGRDVWVTERPATAVQGDPRISPPGWRGNPEDYADGKPTRSGDNAVRVTVAEAAILQGFPPGYPFEGDPAKPNSRTKQFECVGNAVPPPLARACFLALLDEGVRDVAA